ncbi:MAG: RNA-binding protein [Ignavibacteriales bacterium]|nr:RNA-binding protein [Ignavibacteriales bacterium]
MNLFVGNLSHGVSEDDLRAEFQAFGEIKSIQIIKDKFSGESKGFGFVEMPKKEEAEAAMKALNSKPLDGKAIVVNEARPREERGGGGGRRGGGGRGGFGGGGGRRGGGGGGRRF